MRRWFGWGVLLAACSAFGLPERGELNEAQYGRLLFDELACAACHEAGGGDRWHPASELVRVGQRLRPDSLLQLAEDHQPGLRLSKDEATQLTHFLLRRGAAAESERVPFPEPNAARGKTLYHKVGCVACHGPIEGEHELLETVKRYRLDGLASALFRPTGAHPDMRLSRQEASDLAHFLLPAPAFVTFQGDGKALPKTLVLRPFATAKGRIEKRGDRQFVFGGIRLDVGEARPRLRAFGEGQELLVEVSFEEGKAEAVLSYEFE